MKNYVSLRLWLFLLGLSSTANNSLGDVMLSPVSVSTDIPTYPNDTITVTNMIDHSGVTTAFTNGVTSFDEYFSNSAFATSGNGGTNNWQSDVTYDCGTNQGTITFDLGATYEITKLAIWNKSLSNVTVKVLADLAGPEQIVGNYRLTNHQSFPFSYPADLLGFNTTYEGRYIRLEINSVYIVSPGFNFGYSIVGEVVASVVGGGASTPSISIISETDGDVTVNFTGTLLTSLSPTGTFTNVPGNPSSPYMLPRTNLLSQQFFRAQGN